jgi:pimeloyl-ACP methyl ester carboxylesterase
MSYLKNCLKSLLIVVTVSESLASAESIAYRHGAYETKRVTFTSEGSQIVGTLFSPLAPQNDDSSAANSSFRRLIDKGLNYMDSLFSNQAAKARPAVVILGPFGSIKEQSPLQYASRLAREGYVALIFDPRYSGESEGEPRRLESPSAKIRDVEAAIEFITKQPGIDAKRLALLGICQGTSEMLAVASKDSRIKTLTLVSGQYIFPSNIDGFFSGGGPTRLDRIERGKAALELYKKTGEVKYTEVIHESDKSVGLPWKPIYDWYHPWTTEKWLKPSLWENRYATMSDAEVWSFNVDEYTSKITMPTLIIHGEMSDGNVPAAQHVFDGLGAKDKKLVIVPGIFHTRFYDDPQVIDPAASTVSQWLAAHFKD